MEFLLQPNICKTNSGNTLMDLLEKVWIKNLKANGLTGQGTIYIMSGFSNFNGGIRFYNYIEDHIRKGGQCKVILGGSKAQNMSSQQVVTKLLEIGCKVGIINRKAIFHAKCYGYQFNKYKSLIVTSGNFTSRGLTQNIEASLLIENEDFQMKFEWEDVFKQLRNQKIYYYSITSIGAEPAWNLLFDESHGRQTDESATMLQTLVITLSHSDTVRIQAEPNTKANQGTQYFWLSKDSYDFFPPLNEKNQRGTKNAYQTLIKMNYIDLAKEEEIRVTFEAENNFDFRLGTGTLRNTKIANEGDMAAISRISFDSYEMRIFKKNSNPYNALIQYASNFIGHRGKQYGYLPNHVFKKILKNG